MQWGLFRELALASGPDRRSISSSELAHRSDLREDTVAETVAFLATVSLVEGTRQQCAVTKAGWEIAAVCRQDETQGRLLLLPLFMQHWSVPLVHGLLFDAPLEQATLVARLRQATGIAPRRAQYLLEWLVLALVLRQDPALRLSPSAACTVPLTQAKEAPLQDPPRLLMGLTHTELQALPTEHYITLLEQVSALFDLDLS